MCNTLYTGALTWERICTTKTPAHPLFGRMSVHHYDALPYLAVLVALMAAAFVVLGVLAYRAQRVTPVERSLALVGAYHGALPSGRVTAIVAELDPQMYAKARDAQILVMEVVQRRPLKGGRFAEGWR